MSPTSLLTAAKVQELKCTNKN